MSSKKGFFCLNTLKQFDAFAKPLEEVQIKTVWGGIGKNLKLISRVNVFGYNFYNFPS